MSASVQQTVFVLVTGTQVEVEQSVGKGPLLHQQGQCFIPIDSYTIEPSAPSVQMSKICFKLVNGQKVNVEVFDETAKKFDEWFQRTFYGKSVAASAVYHFPNAYPLSTQITARSDGTLAISVGNSPSEQIDGYDTLDFRDGTGNIVFETKCAGRVESGRIPKAEVDDFDRWTQKHWKPDHTVKLQTPDSDLELIGVDLASEPDRTVTQLKTCDECFGTGFRHGFGAPCSRGCK